MPFIQIVFSKDGDQIQYGYPLVSFYDLPENMAQNSVSAQQAKNLVSQTFLQCLKVINSDIRFVENGGTYEIYAKNKKLGNWHYYLNNRKDLTKDQAANLGKTIGDIFYTLIVQGQTCSPQTIEAVNTVFFDNDSDEDSDSDSESEEENSYAEDSEEENSDSSNGGGTPLHGGKSCKKNEILNPDTGRCVSKDGKIGKRVLRNKYT